MIFQVVQVLCDVNNCLKRDTSHHLKMLLLGFTHIPIAANTSKD